MRIAFLAPLALSVLLAGCKTTSSSPSTPQPPGSPPAASPQSPAGASSPSGASRPSPSSRSAAAGTRAGAPESAAGRPGEPAQAAHGESAQSTSGSPTAEAASAGEPADQVALEDPSRPAPASDQVTLEDSEQQAQGDAGEAGGGSSEQAVLEAALEAMRQEQTDDPQAGGAATDGSASTADGGTPGAPTQSGSSEGSGDAVREAVDGVKASATGGGGELEQLNRELNESLARFDGAMLGERERSQARGEETGGARAGGETLAKLDDKAAGEDGSETGSYGAPMPARSGKGSAPGTANDTSSGGGMSSAGGGSGRQGDYQHTASSNTVPVDIPDGSDDDVVARQIREAAMKERDPELREKLWQEYRKYTNSAKRKG